MKIRAGGQEKPEREEILEPLEEPTPERRKEPVRETIPERESERISTRMIAAALSSIGSKARHRSTRPCTVLPANRDISRVGDAGFEPAISAV